MSSSEWVFEGSYERLPQRFFARTPPTPVADPTLIKFNWPLAAELGLPVEGLAPQALAAIFAGNQLVPGSVPLAMAYAGHQFGQFVPELGDGRAILLGEVRDRDGRRRDIQLKGAGRTPYSRGGDGRAALGPVLREYLVSEAMHAFGIPSTRALAAVASGEAVYRNGELPGAIVTRVAASHVRVGTFQFFAARGDADAVKQLADYTIARHYPDARGSVNPYLELIRRVVRRQARLVAAWMNVGFIHGVMNTDNTAVSGETIDFGPCAFLDAYDPNQVFSSIDHAGRYAYSNQAAAAQWNSARFAETLLPLVDPQGERAIDLATEAVIEFTALFDAERSAGLRRKLGLFTQEAGDGELIRNLFQAMQAGAADFTLTFRRLYMAIEDDAAGALGGATSGDPAWLIDWMKGWRQRLAHESQAPAERALTMRLANPAVIPRNHRVEAMISAAVQRRDFAPFEEFARVLARPFEDPAGFSEYASPPREEERVLQTVCGT